MKELSNWLIGNGYKIANNNANAKEYSTNWYAEKRIKNVRKCEQTGRTPKIIIIPYTVTLSNGDLEESIVVEIAGKYREMWWRVGIYTTSSNTLMQNLGMIEDNFVKSWEGLL